MRKNARSRTAKKRIFLLSASLFVNGCHCLSFGLCTFLDDVMDFDSVAQAEAASLVHRLEFFDGFRQRVDLFLPLVGKNGAGGGENDKALDFRLR